MRAFLDLVNQGSTAKADGFISINDLSGCPQVAKDPAANGCVPPAG